MLHERRMSDAAYGAGGFLLCNARFTFDEVF
jgi:hypothetical protein